MKFTINEGGKEMAFIVTSEKKKKRKQVLGCQSVVKHLLGMCKSQNHKKNTTVTTKM
jgi:hypothetical protein